MSDNLIHSNKKEGSESKSRKRQKTIIIKEVPLHRRLDVDIDDYLKDTECIIDMYRTVIPVLEGQDNLRKKELRSLKKKIKDFGQHKKPFEGSTKIDIFRTIKILFDILNKLDRGTNIFRNNIIISLVSRYDEYVGDIIRIILKNNPDPLFNPDKSLSLKEILELGSIDRIRDKFLEKEVDNILRGSHTSHFDYLEKRLDIPLRKNLPIWSSFIEVTERRNLLAHCGGIISSQYLKICRDNKVEFDEFEGRIMEGKKIAINDKYIENAFITLYEMGFKIGQTIFRKIFPDKNSLQIADNSLNEIGYNHLKAERWDLAKIIFEYAYNLSSNWISTDRFNKMFLINLCIALKKLDDIDKVMELLDTVDWSSAGLEFILAVSVLKDDYSKCEKIMSLMNRQEPITENDFREWPLFIDFRKTEYFARAFKKIYEKEYDGMPSDMDLKL